jgi:hypothetical protein
MKEEGRKNCPYAGASLTGAFSHSSRIEPYLVKNNGGGCLYFEVVTAWLCG